MPSSYTSSLKLTLPQTGDLIGSWGGVVNSGVTSLVDQAVAGSVTITMTADTNYTLTSTNGASDEARNMFINVSGGPHTLTKNVVCPSVSKLFVVTNDTTGGQAILFKTSAGSGVTIPNGVRAVVYCDGTDVGLVNMISLVDTATVPFTGSLALISPDAGITTVADTAGFSGLSVFVDGTAENTTIGMYGDTAAGTTAGVSNASLGVVTFDSASAGMFRTTAASAPLYFVTSNGLQMEIGDNTGVTLYGNGTEGGQLSLNNPNDASVGGYLDVSVSDTLRLFTPRNNSAIQIGQLGAGLTGGTIGLYTENTERMRITNTGTVGIGTTTPLGKVHIDTSTAGGSLVVSGAPVAGAVNTLIWNTDGAANSSGGLVFWNDQNPFAGYSAAVTFFSSGSGNEFRITQNVNAPLTTWVNGSERMRITGAGNVGVGTSSPSVKLDVVGAIKATDDITTTGGVLVTAANDGVGYGTGAGGSVSQTPTPTSSVTLNKPCGQIVMDPTSWSSGQYYVFTFNNSLIAATDVLIVHPQSMTSDTFAPQYMTARASRLSAGSAIITVQLDNEYGGSVSGTLTLNFVLIKSVTA